MSALRWGVAISIAILNGSFNCARVEKTIRQPAMYNLLNKSEPWLTQTINENIKSTKKTSDLTRESVSDPLSLDEIRIEVFEAFNAVFATSSSIGLPNGCMDSRRRLLRFGRALPTWSISRVLEKLGLITPGPFFSNVLIGSFASRKRELTIAFHQWLNHAVNLWRSKPWGA